MAIPLCSTGDELARELRGLLRAGLPATERSAGLLLPNQCCVVANAQHPLELGSRLTALNRLLGDLLRDLGNGDYGRAARIVFGADRALRGTTLTYRRQQAAEELLRHEDHFRKHVEPRLLTELAEAMHGQNLRYTPVSSSSRPPLGVYESTPVLTAGALTEQEELTCRLWSAVYGYRAEMIGVQRAIEEEGREAAAADPEVRYRLDSASWQLARLLTFVSEYVEQFGETVLHGETPYAVEGLVALAGWHGGIGSEEAKRLRLRVARSGRDERGEFVARTHPHPL